MNQNLVSKMTDGSNDAVGSDELPGHLHVPTGLVDEGQVEGNLPPQVHLVVCDALRGQRPEARSH